MIVFKGGGRSSGGVRTGLGKGFAGLASCLLVVDPHAGRGQPGFPAPAGIDPKVCPRVKEVLKVSPRPRGSTVGGGLPPPGRSLAGQDGGGVNPAQPRNQARGLP